MSEFSFEPSTQTPLHGHLERIRAEISQVVIGQDQLMELLLIGLLCDGHVLLEGVPGVAKTLTAKVMAKVVAARFSRIQFTPDLMPSDVVGTSVYNPQDGKFHFKSGPVFSHLVLIDEVNRAPAKTQAALFEVMEERQVTVDGHTYKMDYPFLILATQNPIEQEGTYRLPEAQLDRFLFKILFSYPTLEEETELLNRQQGRSQHDLLDQVNQVLSIADLQLCRQAVQAVTIDTKLVQYIARLVQETRTNPAIYLGGSPRASLALLRSAKAKAALQGRDFVIPEDVQDMALPVLRHRIMLTPEKEMEGLTADTVIQQLLQQVDVPR